MKEKIIINVIYFLVSYLIIFLLYSLVINRKKKSYKDATKQMDILYLVNKFKLNTKKTKYNTLKWITNIINPLIISITFIIVTNIKSFILGIMIGFLVMMMLIYSIYEIIGRILKKKEFDKNV
ncbi:unknown [Clostridium sp. CAG:628]|jgi:FlaA1/EpsC-like NDP-sugar epimerase|nr:unknown [Clostridium sp. CAG:628]